MKLHHSAVRAVLVFAAAVLLWETAALGQPAFDPPEVRATSDVVAPELLRGPHYQLGPTVKTFTFMNQYTVASDYGAFTPRATPGCGG